MRIPHVRTSCLLALAAVLAPLQSRADTVLATSHITAVTIYPEGARITREVTFTAAPGPHDVLITDLPAAVEPTMIRLASPDAALGAFALRTDRLPPRAEPTTPARDAAKAAVRTAEAALAEAQAAVSAINAQVEAQEAQISFLTKLRLDAAGATADSLTAIADMVRTKVLVARQAAQMAQAGLPAAMDGVTRASDALSQAQAALGALSKGDADYVALSVAVTSSAPTTHLTVTHFTADATWAPVYDMALDRTTPSLTVERGVLVSQHTGEDWAGVDLTLSTAQPTSQSEPTTLYPELKSIGDPEPMAKSAGAAEGMADAVMSPAPVVESRVTAAMSYQGDTVVYHYPAAVDVADGVENLRLALDTLTFTPQVQARAVPRHDATAFLVARLTNTGSEILLPGTAYLTRDGVLTGATQLVALTPGADTTLGFGAIEGLKLTRDMPKKAEGDRGLFSTSTQIEEKAVLKVENLTDEAWPLHLIDLVPYSEQEDLQITYTADPAPSATDVEGQRGILAWDFTLGPKQTREVRLDTLTSWPQGKVLH